MRLLPKEEIREIALEAGYEDDENRPAEDAFLDELESTMVELQVKAYMKQQEANSITAAAYKVTQMVYSIYEQDQIIDMLNSICDQVGATTKQREEFMQQAKEMLAERDDSINARFGKSDGPLL